MLVTYALPVRKKCWIDDVAKVMTNLKCESSSIKEVIVEEFND
jgi:hypothetical protein